MNIGISISVDLKPDRLSKKATGFDKECFRLDAYYRFCRSYNQFGDQPEPMAEKYYGISPYATVSEIWL